MTGPRRFPGIAPAACAAAIVALLAAAGPGAAAVYYVDPATGDDASAGTTQAAPWKTVPGTRTAADGGFLQVRWGAIGPTNRIRPGDVVELKAGATMTAAVGGRLVVDGTYYDDGTPEAPITIRVSATWGSGPFTIDCTGMAATEDEACVWIPGRSWIWIRGAGPDRRFVVAGTPSGVRLVAMSWQGSAAAHTTGAAGEYLEIRDTGLYGLDMSWTDGWTVKDAVAHHNATGFVTGRSASSTTLSNGTFYRCESYQNGLAATGENRHGFTLANGVGTLVLASQAWGNGRDGFDAGAVGVKDVSVVFLDSRAWENGEDAFACSGSNATRETTVVHTGSIGFGGQSAFTTYEGCQLFLYHAIAARSGWGNGSAIQVNVSPGADCGGTCAPVRLEMANSIVYKSWNGSDARPAVTGIGSSPTRTVVDDHDVYVPTASDAEQVIGWVAGTHAAPPALLAASSLTGLAADVPPLFTATDPVRYLANDFRLGPGSKAVDRALALCRATSPAGQGTRVGVSCDPRRHFYLAAGRPLLPPDVAYVGSPPQRCEVVALDATGVTCASPVGWATGDVVWRWPQAGAALDVGPFEAAAGAPLAPELLSVEPR